MISRLRWLAFFACWLSACSRCGRDPRPGGRAPELTARLPRAADAVVVAPDLAALGEAFRKLERLKALSFIAQLQGFGNASDYVGAATGQWGLDPRSPQVLEAAGVNSKGALAVVLLPGRRAYGLVPLRDGGRFETWVTGWARDRLGATRVTRSDDGRGTALSFSRDGGAAAELSVLLTDDAAWVAPKTEGAALRQMAYAAQSEPITAEPDFNARWARASSERQLWLYVPPASGWVRRMGSSGLVTAAVLSDALTLRGDLAGDKAAASPEAEAASSASAAPMPTVDLSAFIPGDAFLVARLGGNPADLSAAWRMAVGPSARRRLDAAGFDLEGEVLGNLKPGAVASVSLAPDVRLAGGVPSLDVRRTNPFRFIQLTGAAEVADAARARATLAKLPSAAPALSARISPGEVAGTPAYFTSYEQGEGVHFAAVGERVLFGAPRAAFETLVRGTATGSAAGKPERLWTLPEEASATALVLDVRRLTRAVRSLPSDAWGIGGFAVKASALRWLDAVGDLQAVELTSSPGADARRVALRFRFAAP